MSAGADSAAFKRLRREVDLTGASSGSLSFKFSADLEPNWDYMAVEVREVGTENWTTLPAANVTTQGTGQSCPAGWRDLHPQLDHYQTLTGATCTADRQHPQPGRLERLHGQLGGLAGLDGRPERLRRQEDRGLDLGHHRLGHARARGLGRRRDDHGRHHVDDGRLRGRHRRLGARAVARRAPPNPVVGWERVTEQFQEGAVVATDDTVYTGFGFEGISTEAKRKEFMNGVLRHLGILQ